MSATDWEKLNAACPDKKPVETEDLTCPFCKEGDFDKIGLKHHFLMGHCDVFENTERVTHHVVAKGGGLEWKRTL